MAERGGEFDHQKKSAVPSRPVETSLVNPWAPPPCAQHDLGVSQNRGNPNIDPKIL